MNRSVSLKCSRSQAKNKFCSVQWSRFSKSLVYRVYEALPNRMIFIQELDALFNQDAMFENVIDCRLRQVKYDKEALEKEWLDLTPFLRDRLRSRNSWFLL